MSQFDPRFTPLPAADNGWQQANLAGGAVLLTSLFVVPQLANSAWIQVPAGQTLQFRTDGDTSGTDFMVLPGPSFYPLTNRQAINQLVVKSPAGTTVVCVAFFTGSVGPIPPAPQVAGTGGVIPPPPPGLSAVRTPNVLHVMPEPTGNDATGAPYRLDLPYATPAAAEAAAQAGDTVQVWAGTFVGVNLGSTTNVNWVLNGAILEDNGSDPVFLFNGPNCTLGGVGLINSLSSAVVIDMVNSGVLRIQVPVNAAGTAIRNSGGTALTVESAVSAGVALELQNAGGTTNVFGDVLGNVLASGGLTSCNVWGNITGGITADQGSRIAVQGNVVGNVLADNSSRLSIDGQVTGNVDAQNGSFLVLNGTTIGSCASRSESKMEIYGSIEGSAICVRGEQFIDGIIVASQSVGALCDGGIQRIIGRVQSDVVAVACSDGLQEVIGTVISTSNFGATIVRGTQRITGRIESCRACLAIEDSLAPYNSILGAGTVLVADTGACGAVASVVTLDGNPVTVKCMGVFANLPFEPNVSALIQAPIVSTQVQ